MTVEFVYWLGLGTIAISYSGIGTALVVVVWASIDLKRSAEQSRLQKIVAAVLTSFRSKETEIGNRENEALPAATAWNVRSHNLRGLALCRRDSGPLAFSANFA